MRPHHLLKAFLFSTLLTGSLNAQPAPESVVTLNVEPSKEHPRNSEGSFATLASGRILFCYSQFYGGAGDESPARIVRIHSDDEGRTWSAPVTVVENTGGDNVMSVSLLRLASGKLAMFYCIKNSWIDCRPHMCLSTDDGETWSAPKLVQNAPGYFVLNNDRVIQTEKGRIIGPKVPILKAVNPGMREPLPPGSGRTMKGQPGRNPEAGGPCQCAAAAGCRNQVSWSGQTARCSPGAARTRGRNMDSIPRMRARPGPRRNLQK